MVSEAPPREATLHAVVALMRPRDWVKNGLVAAPLLFGGKVTDPEALLAVGLAFLALSLAASAGYLWNDLRDVESDRQHPVKRDRPIASGVVSPGLAWLASAVLVAAAGTCGLSLGGGFLLILSAYLVLSALYTVWLKHVVIVDVMALGSFYVIRVLAGAEAVEVQASYWLLVATGLLAVFIGLCKRRHELVLLGGDAENHRGVLGQYSERFLDPAISLTTSTTLVTYLLYATSTETVEKFGSRGMLLAAPFVLYGLLRYLHLVYTKEVGGSPSELVTTDPGVLVACLGFALVCGYVVYS
jgi:4-hydroxybenzoate polyprenyltransferase